MTSQGIPGGQERPAGVTDSVSARPWARWYRLRDSGAGYLLRAGTAAALVIDAVIHLRDAQFYDAHWALPGKPTSVIANPPAPPSRQPAFSTPGGGTTAPEASETPQQPRGSSV